MLDERNSREKHLEKEHSDALDGTDEVTVRAQEDSDMESPKLDEIPAEDGSEGIADEGTPEEDGSAGTQEKPGEDDDAPDEETADDTEETTGEAVSEDDESAVPTIKIKSEPKKSDDGKSNKAEAPADDETKPKKKDLGAFERFEMREPKKKEAPKKSKDGHQTFQEYIGEVVEETKRVTWPTKPEVLKWSMVVLAALAFFTLFTFLVDTFIASPIIYNIGGFASGEGFGKKAIMLSVLFVLTGLGSAAGVMLHAGGEQSGLSEGLSTSLTGGSAVAEKNLDRLTIAMIVLFTATTIAMMIWFPLGTMGN